MRVDAVVLAGGTIPDSEAEFRKRTGVRCKSLVPIAGKIMVGWVVEALRGAERIDRVAVIGPPELRRHRDCAGADVVLEEREGRSENLFAALEAFPDSERVLMVTSDIPLATGAMFDRVLERVVDSVDLGYVIVRAEDAQRRFGDRPDPPPDLRGKRMPAWVTAKLREGEFTGTPCLLLRPSALSGCRTFIKSIFDNRELGNALRTLAPLFGWDMLLRAVLALRVPALAGILSIAEVQERLGLGLGLLCQTYVSPDPELAFDVDHLSDVALAERVLAARGAV